MPPAHVRTLSVVSKVVQLGFRNIRTILPTEGTYIFYDRQLVAFQTQEAADMEEGQETTVNTNLGTRERRTNSDNKVGGSEQRGKG